VFRNDRTGSRSDVITSARHGPRPSRHQGCRRGHVSTICGTPTLQCSSMQASRSPWSPPPPCVPRPRLQAHRVDPARAYRGLGSAQGTRTRTRDPARRFRVVASGIRRDSLVPRPPLL
jgi:hypothetical protein